MCYQRKGGFRITDQGSGVVLSPNKNVRRPIKYSQHSSKDQSARSLEKKTINKGDYDDFIFHWTQTQYISTVEELR